MKSDPLITYRRKPAHLDSKALDRFAARLRERIAKGREFHCLISGDAELRRLNREFRGKDYATDVLSFPSDDRSYLGDLAISLARARQQARAYGHSIENELGILMLHGVLHLTGLDHEADHGRMERAERRWRREFALPLSLTERARNAA
jgi:probable rRNA maturation factor